MARHTVSATVGQNLISFANGTVIRIPDANVAVTQFTNEGRGLRSSQLPSDRDTSPQFDRAMEELAYTNKRLFISI